MGAFKYTLYKLHSDSITALSPGPPRFSMDKLKWPGPVYTCTNSNSCPIQT